MRRLTPLPSVITGGVALLVVGLALLLVVELLLLRTQPDPALLRGLLVAGSVLYALGAAAIAFATGSWMSGPALALLLVLAFGPLAATGASAALAVVAGAVAVAIVGFAATLVRRGFGRALPGRPA